jgi:hypothetical protein
MGASPDVVVVGSAYNLVVEGYRTASLAGLWTHQKGGFFHDGRFATLLEVVNHYDGHFRLNLSDANKKDLIEYLKGI